LAQAYLRHLDTPPGWPLRAEHGPGLFLWPQPPGLGHFAGDCREALLVRRRQVVELEAESCDDVIVGLHRHRGAFVGEGDAGGSPVVRVASAGDESSLFEAVDEVASTASVERGPG
jgi:hypothetical protein